MSTVVVSICIPTNSFSTPSAAFIHYRFLFNDTCPDQCEVIVILIYISLIMSDIEHFFMCLQPSVGPVFVGEMSAQVFCPFLIGLFLFLILRCMSYLYILEINPLAVALFVIIFSHSEDCLFILFMVSFAMQKLLSLIRFHLFVFLLFQEWVVEDLASIYVTEHSAYVCL